MAADSLVEVGLLHCSLPVLYPLLPALQRFLVGGRQTPWHLTGVPLHLEGHHQRAELCRRQDAVAALVQQAALGTQQQRLVPDVGHHSQTRAGHVVLKGGVVGVEGAQSEGHIAGQEQGPRRGEQVDGAVRGRADQQAAGGTNQPHVLTTLHVNAALHRAQHHRAVPTLIQTNRPAAQERHLRVNITSHARWLCSHTYANTTVAQGKLKPLRPT